MSRREIVKCDGSGMGDDMDLNEFFLNITGIGLTIAAIGAVGGFWTSGQ